MSWSVSSPPPRTRWSKSPENAEGRSDHFEVVPAFPVLDSKGRFEGRFEVVGLWWNVSTVGQVLGTEDRLGGEILAGAGGRAVGELVVAAGVVGRDLVAFGQ